MVNFNQLPAPYELKPQGSDEELVRSMVPEFSDPRMADYLVLRSVNFSHVEACLAIKISHGEYMQWRDNDSTFAMFVTQNLRKLQRNMGVELIKASFMRNMFLQLHIDSDVLTARAFAKEEMGAEDREDAREAAKRYAAPAVAQMLKILEGDGDGSKPPSISFDLKVDVSLNDADQIVQRKAQARGLLQQFSRNKDVVELEVISSSQELDDGSSA